MNYKGSIHDRITVERGIIQAQLEIEDTPYSQDLIATVHTDIKNHFIVQIGDYKRDMYVPESGLSVNLGSNWDVGKYTASLIFEGDKYYAPFTLDISFKVYDPKDNLLNNRSLLTEDSKQTSFDVNKIYGNSISSVESFVNENQKYKFGYDDLNSINEVKKDINSSNDSVVKTINPSSSLIWGILIIALICGISVVYYKKRQ